MIDKLEIKKEIRENISSQRTNKYFLATFSMKAQHKEENADAVMVTSHPQDDNVKMIVVADGITNCDAGEAASKYVADSLQKWFTEIKIKSEGEADKYGLGDHLDYINNTSVLKSLLLGKIRDLNLELAEKYNGKAETTLICVVIGLKETLIASVGDSRVYTVKNKKMKLHTTDHLVWFAYNSSPKLTTDQVKYLAGRSYIYKFLGGYPNPALDLGIDINIEDDTFSCHQRTVVGDKSLAYVPDITVIDNDDYDALFACTDGIHGVIPEAQLESAINKDHERQILERIALESICSKPLEPSAELVEAFGEMAKDMLTATKPGSDDISMVLYKKYKK